ncbi:unnamed protein product [Chironomus riparius]|uniref:Uncharacterized protein n=1 Tax=Chironomus riparius TaxID=315576 RepID=A0A9N9WZH6_9DIPT|nr:unnamed protein product [Chironomus riparius]
MQIKVYEDKISKQAEELNLKTGANKENIEKISNLQNQSSNLKIQLQLENAKLQKLSDENSNLKLEMQKIEVKNKQLESELSLSNFKSQDVESCRKSILNLQENLITEGTKLHITERQLNGAKADLKKVQRDLKFEKNNNAQCENKLKFNANKFDTMQKNLNKTIESLEDNYKNLKVEFHNLQKNLSDITLAYNSTLLQLDQTKEFVQNLKNQLEMNEQKSITTIQNLSNDIKTTKEELENFKNKAKQLKMKVIEKDGHINDLTISNNKILNNVRDLKDKYDILNLESNQNILQLNQLNNQTTKKLQESQNKNNLLTNQLKTKTELSQNLQKSVDQKSREVQGLQGIIKNLNLNLQDSRNHSKFLEANFSSTVDNITTKNAKEVEEYQAIITNFTEVSAELRQNIIDHKDTIKLKELENLNLSSIITDKSNQISSYENQVLTLNQELKESIAISEDLSTELKDTTAELENLKIIKTKFENINQILNKEVEIVNVDFLKCKSLPRYTWNNHPIMFVSIPIMCILTIIDICASLKCFR